VRVRIVLLVSIVLNVALVAAFLGWFGPGERRASGPVGNASAAANSNTPRIIKTNILVRPRFFNWEEVESGDYAIYIQNLRGIGMPENTIRDVIIADIDQLFTQRRRELAAQQDLEWWRSRPSESYQSNALAGAYALEQERSALLTKLLGQNWKADRLDQQPEPVPLTGPVLSALPAELKKTVQNIAAQSAERMRDYLIQAQTSGQQPNELEIARMREQTREQLAQVLNPLQLEEFLIRNSYNASRLRREFEGVDLNQEEFRRLFRAVDAIDRDLQLRYAGDDAESQRRRQALEQQRQAVLRETLGAERYDTLAMLQDPTYQEALTAVQRVGASEEAAAALYEIGRATTDEVARIQNDPALTPTQKQLQIREAELERQRARSLVLGEPMAEPAVPEPPPYRAHVKVPGETLGELSVRYGVGISELREANPEIDINRAPPGVVLNVPTRPAAPQTFPIPPVSPNRRGVPQNIYPPGAPR
jgi:LysM repeat protein